MQRTRTAGMACLLATAMLAGCSKVEERLILPWFKVRISTSPRIGGLADPVQRTTHLVKRFGFWWQIDDTGVGMARVLNATTVAYYNSGEARLIHQGEWEATFACGRGSSGASFPAGLEAVDCVDVLEGSSVVAATKVRFRRISASGAVLNDKTIAVDGPGRVFLRPIVTFYDDDGTAYLVTWDRASTEPGTCAIVAVGTAEVTFTAGPPAMRARDCEEASGWVPIVGRAIRSRDK